MSRFKIFALAAALLFPATAALAYDDGLTNGPNGTLSNTPDSARGFDGINAVAPEREFLYHPERAGNAAAAVAGEPEAGGGTAAPATAPGVRPARHRRRHHLMR